jgi:hypothetical protein
MLSFKPMLAKCSLNTFGDKTLICRSASIFLGTNMLKTNGLTLDFLFHNIKPNIDVLGSLALFIVVSIKYCWLIVTVYL